MQTPLSSEEKKRLVEEFISLSSLIPLTEEQTENVCGILEEHLLKYPFLKEILDKKGKERMERDIRNTPKETLMYFKYILKGLNDFYGEYI